MSELSSVNQSDDCGELISGFTRGSSGDSTGLNGLASEHLVCSDLAFQGYKVSLAPQMCPYDILVDTGDRILRVQVKSTAKLRDRPHINKPSRYRFQLKKGGGSINTYSTRRNYHPSEVDMFALVAADIKVIAYIPVLGEITTNLEFFPTRDNRRSTSRVITDFPFNKALTELNQFKQANQPLISCGEECSTQNQTASYLSGERDIKDVPT